ncbi:MAG: hypothetical protein AAF664_15140 [Planctomycetota bacterium]
MDFDRIKAGSIEHFEKAIFGLIVILGFALLWFGFSKENFLAIHQPDELDQMAKQVRNQIEDDHSESVIEGRTEKIDIEGRTSDLYRQLDWTSYSLPQTWQAESIEAVIRRQDPILAPIESLQTTGVICTLAYNNGSKNYPIEELAMADEKQAEEQPRRSRRSNRRNRAAMMGMGMGGMDMDPFSMMGAEQESSRGRQDDEPKEGNRKISRDSDRGVKTAPEDDYYPQPRLGWFIAGAAVLPHQKVYESHELAFANASDYDEQRDTPNYIDFEVQRADVTGRSAEDLQEDEWLTIWNRKSYTILVDRFWSGFAAEIVPGDYRDANLTMWLPPVLLKDIRSFASHPMIPEKSVEDLAKEARASEDTGGPIFDLDGAAFEEDQFELAGGNQGRSRGRTGGYDPMMDMEMYDSSVGGFVGGGVESNPVDYKLVRFYDFYDSKIKFLKDRAPRPGRSYVYRMRYAVIDPNFPLDESQQPKLSILGPEVAARVGLKIEDAQEKQKRDHKLWSEWSQPSAPATLPSPVEMLAGDVTRGRSIKRNANGRTVDLFKDDPKAKLIVKNPDANLGTQVPVLIDGAIEGLPLSGKFESVDLIDPINRKIKKTDSSYSVDSQSVMVDISGGEELEIAEDMTAPGQMLILQSDGSLKVLDAIENQNDYKIYAFEAEEE